MGFTIMESFMDSLRVRSAPGKGTVVTMKRKIALRGGEGDVYKRQAHGPRPGLHAAGYPDPL